MKEHLIETPSQSLVEGPDFLNPDALWTFLESLKVGSVIAPFPEVNRQWVQGFFPGSKPGTGDLAMRGIPSIAECGWDDRIHTTIEILQLSDIPSHMGLTKLGNSRYRCHFVGLFRMY